MIERIEPDKIVEDNEQFFGISTWFIYRKSREDDYCEVISYEDEYHFNLVFINIDKMTTFNIRLWVLDEDIAQALISFYCKYPKLRNEEAMRNMRKQWDDWIEMPESWVVSMYSKQTKETNE